MSIAENIEAIYENIERAAQRSGRKKEDITLLAVSKTKPVWMLREAYEAGMRDFGENHVQEFLEKKEVLPKDIRWHLIGRLQTNKVKYIIKDVYLLHALDRLHLAQSLQKAFEKNGQQLSVLLEVNAAKEDSKAGFYEEELLRAAQEIAGMPNLRVRGVMTVAPNIPDEKLLHDVFAKTRMLRDRLAAEHFSNFDLDILSMGMSGDYEIAIEEGSTMVRVGSAIFGQRQYN